MNKVAIVTGASKGIGSEIASSLAKKGITVVANYNNSEKEILELKDALKKENVFIDIFKADVSTNSGVQELVDYTINKYNRIDILVNNAGISINKLIIDTTDDDWNNLISTNLFSAFAMCRAVSSVMISQKSGKIINISSIWGQIGASMESLYSISKAGVDGLTKSLAKELGPSNIHVNSIAPGIIDTQMNAHLTDVELNNIKEEIPLGKIGIPSDISKCVNWLIDDCYTTGQVICIDGGWCIN